MRKFALAVGVALLFASWSASAAPVAKITAQVATDVVRELRWSALMLAPDQMGGLCTPLR
jgi:hypothetical protein